MNSLFNRNILSALIPALFSSTFVLKATEGNQSTILDLDAMLDTEMDKVETLPDYVTPPAGIYMLEVHDCDIEKFEWKAKDGKPAQKGNRIRITYAVVSTIETKDLPVKDGSLFSDTFMGTEEGLKFFKKQAMNILNVNDTAGAKLKDLMDGIKGTQFKARITIRSTANPAGGSYENAQVRPVHEAAA